MNLFWQHAFGKKESVPWGEFIEQYKQWLKDTFPDVLDEREFEALMSKEAEQSLMFVIAEGTSKANKRVSLEKLASTYPSGSDLFLATKQLINRAIRQRRRCVSRALPRCWRGLIGAAVQCAGSGEP